MYLLYKFMLAISCMLRILSSSISLVEYMQAEQLRSIEHYCYFYYQDRSPNGRKPFMQRVKFWGVEEKT